MRHSARVEAGTYVSEEHGGDIKEVNRALPCVHLTLEIHRRSEKRYLFIHKLHVHAHGACRTVSLPLGLC